MPEDGPRSEPPEFALPSLDGVIEEYRSQPDLVAGLEQLCKYMRQFSSPEEVLAALKFDPPAQWDD